MTADTLKTTRVLELYQDFLSGKLINKQQAAEQYHVNVHSERHRQYPGFSFRTVCQRRHRKKNRVRQKGKWLPFGHTGDRATF